MSQAKEAGNQIVVATGLWMATVRLSIRFQHYAEVLDEGKVMGKVGGENSEGEPIGLDRTAVKQAVLGTQQRLFKAGAAYASLPVCFLKLHGERLKSDWHGGLFVTNLAN